MMYVVLSVLVLAAVVTASPLERGGADELREVLQRILQKEEQRRDPDMPFPHASIDSGVSQRDHPQEPPPSRELLHDSGISKREHPQEPPPSRELLHDSGISKRAWINIKMADLDNRELGDGDRIVMTDRVDSTITSDQVRIGLELGRGETWWKGIMLEGGGNDELVSRQDAQPAITTVIRNTDLNGVGFALWKAKTFGVHTSVYTVTDAREKMQGGHFYSFQWNSS